MDRTEIPVNFVQMKLFQIDQAYVNTTYTVKLFE